MFEDYEKLFSQIKPAEAPAGLFDKILNRIEREKKLVAIKRRIFILSFGILASFAAFIPAFASFKTGIAQSGFVEISSLAFSDMNVVLSHLGQFVLAVVESLPVLNAIFILAIIFSFLGLLKYLSRDISFIINRPKLLKN